VSIFSCRSGPHWEKDLPAFLKFVLFLRLQPLPNSENLQSECIVFLTVVERGPATTVEVLGMDMYFIHIAPYKATQINSIKQLFQLKKVNQNPTIMVYKLTGKFFKRDRTGKIIVG